MPWELIVHNCCWHTWTVVIWFRFRQNCGILWCSCNLKEMGQWDCKCHFLCTSEPRGVMIMVVSCEECEDKFLYEFLILIWFLGGFLCAQIIANWKWDRNTKLRLIFKEPSSSKFMWQPGVVHYLCMWWTANDSQQGAWAWMHWFRI
jgi:hypothetical protein